MCQPKSEFDLDLWRCQHGTYHLVIGNMTLRLKPSQLRKLQSFMATIPQSKSPQKMKPARNETAGEVEPEKVPVPIWKNRFLEN